MRLNTRADVAGNAIDVGVGRDFVSRVFGLHHVAALPAKLRRIHVRRAAIAGHRDHQQVDDRGHQHDVQTVAEDVVIQIDHRECSGNQAGLFQLPSAHPNAQRDQQQSENKEGRQKQKEDDAQIGIFVRAAKQLHQPIADHGHAGSGGDGSAGQTDGVVAEVKRRTHPVFTEFL